MVHATNSPGPNPSEGHHQTHSQDASETYRKFKHVCGPKEMPLEGSWHVTSRVSGVPRAIALFRGLGVGGCGVLQSHHLCGGLQRYGPIGVLLRDPAKRALGLQQLRDSLHFWIAAPSKLSPATPLMPSNPVVIPRSSCSECLPPTSLAGRRHGDR